MEKILDDWLYLYNCLKPGNWYNGRNPFKRTKSFNRLNNSLNDNLAILSWVWFTDKIEVEKSITEGLLLEVNDSLISWGKTKEQKYLDNLFVAADLCLEKGLSIAEFFILWLKGEHEKAEMLVNPLLEDIKESTKKLSFRLYGGDAWAPRKIRTKDLIEIENNLYFVDYCGVIDKLSKRRYVVVHPFRGDKEKINISKIKSGTRMEWKHAREFQQTINPYKFGPQGDLLASFEQRERQKERNKDGSNQA